MTFFSMLKCLGPLSTMLTLDSYCLSPNPYLIIDTTINESLRVGVHVQGCCPYIIKTSVLVMEHNKIKAV